MIHIYTGDGKGKTTAAVGLAVRAAAAGKKVLFFQFLKCDTSSERKILADVDNITVIDVQREIPFLFCADAEVVDEIKALYKQKTDMLYAKSNDYNFFVFDEAVSAVDLGVLDAQDVLRFAENGELVLTGRGEATELSDKADYITEMKKIKHPYDCGIQARKGVEY